MQNKEAMGDSPLVCGCMCICVGEDGRTMTQNGDQEFVMLRANNGHVLNKLFVSQKSYNNGRHIAQRLTGDLWVLCL